MEQTSWMWNNGTFVCGGKKNQTVFDMKTKVSSWIKWDYSEKWMLLVFLPYTMWSWWSAGHWDSCWAPGRRRWLDDISSVLYLMTKEKKGISLLPHTDSSTLCPLCPQASDNYLCCPPCLAHIMKPCALCPPGNLTHFQTETTPTLQTKKRCFPSLNPLKLAVMLQLKQQKISIWICISWCASQSFYTCITCDFGF